MTRPHASQWQPPVRPGLKDVPDWPHSSWKEPLEYPSGALHFRKPTDENIYTAPMDSPMHNQNDVFRVPKQDIIIAGAGIGGLAAAIALKLKGHSVTVLEQGKAMNEVGAGIQIPPNASKLLERWGVFPHLLPHTVSPKYWAIRRWENGEIVGLTNKTNYESEFGAAYYLIHRAHYHQALHERAHELGIEIKLSSQVRSFEENINQGRPGVILENGSKIQADLVVGADGVKGISRAAVNGGKESPPKNTGYVAYRATINAELISRDPELRYLVEEPCLQAWIGPGRHAVTYAIQKGKAYNMVMAVPDKTSDIVVAKKNEVEVMRRLHRGWDPKFVKLLNMTKTALKWPTLTVPHVDRWVSPAGKIVLVGDVAHAMLPFVAQGAAMAVEDAASLAEVITFGMGSQLERLKVYEAIRMRRNHAMQQCSSLQAYILHLPDGPAQEARDAAMRPEVDGKRSAHSPNQFSDPTTSLWLYGYDAQAETLAVLDLELGSASIHT